MDFLRIRQKARERALERERQAAPRVDGAAPSPGEGPGGGAGERASLEEALRVELDVAAALDPAVGDTAEAAVVAEPTPPDDPLDEFFWRHDEVAPTLPDLVAAAEPPPPREPAEIKREWLTFQLGTEEYAVEIQHVREILKAPVLTEVPRAPAHVLGVIMVRGEVVAVFDPRRRLGLPAGEPGRKARVLICDTGNGPRGLLVDVVSHVVRLAPSSVEPRPSGIGGISADYIAGIGRDRSRLFVLLDLSALLADAVPGAGGEARP